jgi:hypothetical protein
MSFVAARPRGGASLKARVTTSLAILLAIAVGSERCADAGGVQTERFDVVVKGPTRTETTFSPTYYVGLLMRSDVLLVEPVQGQYTSIGMLIHQHSADGRRPSYTHGQTVPYFSGGDFKTFKGAERMRIVVGTLGPFGYGQATD